ncbi:MAG: MFS transporter [Alphaproteobacteria bacterium]|nr:MFS transporter [Alphaproteobacteria bacterium]
MSKTAATDAVLARARLRKLTILLTSSMMFLASVVAPGLPALYADFAGLPNAELLSRLVLTMPMLFVALTGPFVGMVVDRYGRRNTLIVSTLGFGLAGTSGLYLESLMAIIVGRAFLGVFLVGVLTSVSALIGDYYSGDERTRVAGLQGAFISFGTLIFTMIGGLLAEIHWRAGFAVFFFSFVMIVPMLLSLYEPATTPRVSRSKPQEPVPKRREWFVIGWIYMLVFGCMIALFMIPAQTPFFLVDIGITNPARAGIAVGIFSFSSGIASLAFPWLRRNFSVAGIFAMIFLDVSVGYILIGRATDFNDVLIAMVVGGFSMGVFFPNANLAIIARTVAAVRGRAVSGLTTAFFLGQFASPFYYLPLAERTSVGESFVITGYALVALGVFFVALAVFNRARRRQNVLG